MPMWCHRDVMNSALRFGVAGGGNCHAGRLEEQPDGSHVVGVTSTLGRVHARFVHTETTDLVGVFDDGCPVSMPGAHPDGNGCFEAPVVVVGTDSITQDTELQGAQFRIPSLTLEEFDGGAAVLDGNLAVSVQGETLTITGALPGVAWHEYLNRTRDAVELLVELWTGEPVDAAELKVLHHEQWLDVLRAVDATRYRDGTLLPASDLTGSAIIKWIERATQLGVVPWVAQPSRKGVLLEMEPLNIGAALEGYAGIVAQSTNPLPKSVRSCAKQAVRDALTRAEVEPDLVDQAVNTVSQCLGGLGQSFTTKVKAQVQGVDSLVPGLIQPSVEEWVKQLGEYRNAFAHMRPGHAKANLRLTRANIDTLTRIAIAGRWVLRIVILRDLAGDVYGSSSEGDERLADALGRQGELQELLT